jgi:hypothetical protein
MNKTSNRNIQKSLLILSEITERGEKFKDIRLGKQKEKKKKKHGHRS